MAIVTCILGALTFYLTVIRDSDQSGDKKVEIRQKEADLFYKQSEIQRAKDAAKADFLQKNLALLTSAQPDSMRQAEALIDASFSSPEDVLDVKTKARHIHESVTELAPEASRGSSQFKAIGFQYASSGHYAEAALSFGNAVNLDPNDIQAWNALSYAQLRNNELDAAYKSISRAISLKPSEGNLPRLVALNATKILCAQGNDKDALVYLNVAIRSVKQLESAARADGELSHLCGFTFE